MACKRSAVRSRLAPPAFTVGGFGGVPHAYVVRPTRAPHGGTSARTKRPLRTGGSPGASPSSRGPGHRPFTAVTGVRIPLGTPIKIIGYARSRQQNWSVRKAYGNITWLREYGLQPTVTLVSIMVFKPYGSEAIIRHALGGQVR